MTSLAILTDQFLEHGRYLRGWSPKTIRTYRQSLAALHAADVGPLTRASLQTFVLWMQARGLTPGGINVRLRTLNAFLSWLREEGHLSEALRVRLLRKSTQVLVTFSDDEVRRIVALRPANRVALRAWTMFILLVDTGLRIEEALTLERHRVNFDALHLTVRGKGARDRIVPMSAECRKALFRLVAKQGGSYVFSTAGGNRLSYRNAYRDLKWIAKQACVEGAHVKPHAVRHYFAVSYLRAGGDLYRLSRVLGHTSIATTQLYLRSMGVEHLQEGHGKYSPLANCMLRGTKDVDH